jgi:hypothetical protein
METIDKPEKSGTRDIRHNGQRAQYAKIMVLVVTGLGLLAAASGYMQYTLLNKMAEGTSYSMAEADSNDQRELVIALLHSVAWIISAVTFIMWFRRAYYNMHQRDALVSYSEGWAAGAWFVPILNLFRPVQIMLELYREAKRILTEGEHPLAAKVSSTLIPIWWSLHIIHNVVSQIGTRVLNSADTVSDYQTATLISISSNLILLPLGIITAKLINDFNKAEEAIDEIVETPAP